MFFMSPELTVLAIYVAAAVLPAFLLLRFIYRMDSIEKEPPRLLWSLVLRGVLAALASIVLEKLGTAALDAHVRQNTAKYIILLAFLVVAVVEEGTKFLFLYKRAWREPNFNYRFDGVVYAVCVSLGFAAFENVGYVFNYGLSVALPRALLSIPGHMSFAVFMGSYFGRAKICEDWGNRAGKIGNLLRGYLVAVVLHGVYDTCAMLGTTKATVVFVAFVAVMYLVVFFRIRREARSDEPV
jgi:RsiW-degrading membrane proteinase PrsW (M82 family)